jgi:hemerythrin-like domain-containing protein
MKELIADLNKDHERIENYLDNMEPLLHVADFKKNLEPLYTLINDFGKLSVLHHAREEEILYPWMIDQNKNSDRDLISKIIEEHRLLEKKVEHIQKEISQALIDPGYPCGNLGYDLSVLIAHYREHAERESSFVFLIAEKLNKAD